MSFKEKAILSLVPTNSAENLDNIAVDGKYQCLKSIAIYGANASGKSNLFKAMTAAILAIRNSNNMQINWPIQGIIPFKFDSEMPNKPTSFEFIFVINGVKYIYGFTANQSMVMEEYLYHYMTAKPSLIFERSNVHDYKFPAQDRKKLNDIAKKNTDNKLFLSTATSWNYEKTKDAFIWFQEGIDTYDNYSTLQNIVFPDFENDIDGSLKKFTKYILREADIDISDYAFEVKITPIEEMPGLPKEIINLITNKDNNVRNIRITTDHAIENEAGETKRYHLELGEESLGTQHLFLFSPVLKTAFDKGKSIVIDEIDKSLHPLLVKHIIELFNNPKFNKNNAQLIFNTHDTNLLTLDLFRRDQIYFTEKNNRNGGSEIYSLDEFSVRKTENIENGYLQGRYGAIPFLGMGEDICD